LHHQATKDIGAGLRVVGRAPDGVVEAVEGTGATCVMAVQNHPKQLWHTVDTRWRNVFSTSVHAARRCHDQLAASGRRCVARHRRGYHPDEEYHQVLAWEGAHPCPSDDAVIRIHCHRCNRRTPRSLRCRRWVCRGAS
jgi:hypothetical protein